MKVQNENLNGAAASQTGRADTVAGADRRGASKPSAASGHGGQDHVELSGLAHEISSAQSAESEARAAHVQLLSKLYQSGNYHVDAAHLGKKIISAWVANGSKPGDVQ